MNLLITMKSTTDPATLVQQLVSSLDQTGTGSPNWPQSCSLIETVFAFNVTWFDESKCACTHEFSHSLTADAALYRDGHKSADDFWPDMSSFPNIDTCLNHLPLAAAEHFEVARNVLIVVLGVRPSHLHLRPTLKSASSQAAMWDIFLYIPDDIGILRQNRIRPVLICFATTR